MNFLLIAIISYLVGSFPTAYLLMKRKGINILESGSGNVGTMNAMRVSGSKVSGLSVFVIDFFKGALAVFITKELFGNQFVLLAFSLIFAVLGHCFSVWLKFKGGRGLATAFGGAMFFAPLMPALWILLWLISYVYKKNVHFANATATFLLLLLVIFSGDILSKYSFTQPTSRVTFSATISVLLVIILVKHIKPLKEYFKSERDKILRKK